MIVLDASALIAMLDPQDAHHATIATTLRSHAADNWRTSALTMAEVMVRAAGDEELLGVLGEDLVELGIDTVALTDEDVEPLARLRATTGLRMPDCCVILTAHTTGGTLLTTDRMLAERARELAIPVLP